MNKPLDTQELPQAVDGWTPITIPGRQDIKAARLVDGKVQFRCYSKSLCEPYTLLDASLVGQDVLMYLEASYWQQRCFALEKELKAQGDGLRQVVACRERELLEALTELQRLREENASKDGKIRDVIHTLSVIASGKAICAEMSANACLVVLSNTLPTPPSDGGSK